MVFFSCEFLFIFIFDDFIQWLKCFLLLSFIGSLADAWIFIGILKGVFVFDRSFVKFNTFIQFLLSKQFRWCPGGVLIEPTFVSWFLKIGPTWRSTLSASLACSTALKWIGVFWLLSEFGWTGRKFVYWIEMRSISKTCSQTARLLEFPQDVRARSP